MTTAEIRRFRRSLRSLNRLFNFQLKRCCSGEVTFAQCLVLLEIDQHGQPTMGHLAAQLRLDGSTLSRTVDGLVKKDLVERVPDERDRRVVCIRLTSQGTAVCRSIHKDNDACVRQLFQNIPARRRGAVIGNFEVLVQAFLAWESDNAIDCGDAIDAVSGAR